MIAVAAPAPLRLRALLAVPVAIAAAVVGALLLAGASDTPSDRASFRLSELAQGVTATDAAGKAVLLSREGDAVIAFLPGVPDRTGRDVAIPCPGGTFITEIRASTFAGDGTKIGGPAERGLDRFPTTVVDDEVVVDTGRVLRGDGDQRSAPVLLPAGAEWDRAFEHATIRGYCSSY